MKGSVKSFRACKSPADYGLRVPTTERELPIAELLGRRPPEDLVSASESLDAAISFASERASVAHLAPHEQPHFEDGLDAQAAGIVLVRGTFHGRDPRGGRSFTTDGGTPILLGKWPASAEVPAETKMWLLMRRAPSPRTWWIAEMFWVDEDDMRIPRYEASRAGSLFAQERRYELLERLDLDDLGIADPEEQKWTFAALAALIGCDPCVDGVHIRGQTLPDWVQETLDLSKVRRRLKSDSKRRLKKLRATRTSRSAVPPADLPAPRLIKSARAAEEYAAEFLRSVGFADATATNFGADGGVDVRSSRLVAQVKMEAVATSRPVIQALFGVASYERKLAAFFSLAGYTREALAWGNSAGIACFEFAIDGSILPQNEAASDMVTVGSAHQSQQSEADGLLRSAEVAEKRRLKVELRSARPSTFPRFPPSKGVIEAVRSRFGDWSPSLDDAEAST